MFFDAELMRRVNDERLREYRREAEADYMGRLARRAEARAHWWDTLRQPRLELQWQWPVRLVRRDIAL